MLNRLWRRSGRVVPPGAPTINAPAASATANSLTPTTTITRGTGDPGDGSVTFDVTLALNGSPIALTGATDINGTSYTINPTALGYLAISDSLYTVTWTPKRGAVVGTAATQTFFVTLLSIVDLRVWDPNTPNTVFQDNAFATPATTDGAVVGGYKDQSSAALNTTQATASQKPTLRLAVQNGLNITRYDGTNDVLAGSGADFSPPFVYIAIANCNASSGSRTLMGGVSAPKEGAIYLDGSGKVSLYNGSIISGILDRRNAWHMFIGTVNGASSSVRMDGAVEVSGNPGSNAMTPILLGGNGGGNPFKGDIGAQALLPRLLTANELAAIETYLRAKWNTP